MKKILLFLLLTIPLLCSAQTIRKKIAQKGNVFINKTIVEGGDPIYLLMGQNSKYSKIIDIIAPVYGDKEHMISFFEEAINLYDKHKGESVSDEIQGVDVSLSKVLGTNYLFINDENGTGYFIMKRKELVFFLSKMKEE